MSLAKFAQKGPHIDPMRVEQLADVHGLRGGDVAPRAFRYCRNVNDYRVPTSNRGGRQVFE